MKTSERAEHRFGGSWTEIKLNAVSDYLNFYTRALQASPSPENPFETWYVDAFAGTGDRTVEPKAGTLFSVEGGTLDRVRLEGSARRAIAVDPPFRHLIFVEKDARRFVALDRVKADHPHRDIRCVPGDANDEIRNIFSQGPWIEPARRGLQRAVVFLDPYGMSVRWDTLRFLAGTSRADVWYLFPLHAALQTGKIGSMNAGPRRLTCSTSRTPPRQVGSRIPIKSSGSPRSASGPSSALCPSRFPSSPATSCVSSRYSSSAAIRTLGRLR